MAQRVLRDRVSQVYEQVRDLIVRGRVAPGVRLVEAQLVERLGVSRTSVRAALQQEGYVTAGDGLRARPMVAPLTAEDARELFAVVGEIEGLGAERAAEMAEDARRALVDRLAVINGEYQRVASEADPDRDELFALDTRFHREYVEAGAGPRLLALHDAVKPQIERYIRIYQQALHEAIQTSVIEHAGIITAIATGSGRSAQESVRTNWRNAATRLQAVIGSRGESGIW